METETLVEALAADTVVPLKLEQSIRLALIAGNIIAGITFFAGIGFRPDIVFAMGTTRFLVKFAVTLPLAFAANCYDASGGAARRFVRSSGLGTRAFADNSDVRCPY